MGKPSQKRFEKKKEREKEVKAKLLRRWLAKKQKDKEQAAWEAKLEAETNPNPVKRKPFRKGDPANIEGTPEFTAEQVKQADIKAKLEHNLAILRALEKEYQDEQRAKLDVNQSLEAEGHIDMKSKLDALQQKLHDYVSTGETTLEPVAAEDVPSTSSSEETPATCAESPLGCGCGANRGEVPSIADVYKMPEIEEAPAEPLQVVEEACKAMVPETKKKRKG